MDEEDLRTMFEDWLAATSKEIRLIHSIVLETNITNTIIMLKGAKIFDIMTSDIEIGTEQLKIGDLLTSNEPENSKFEGLRLEKNSKPPIKVFEENGTIFSNVLAATPAYKWRNPNYIFNSWYDKDNMTAMAWSPDLGQIWDPEDNSADFSKNRIFWAKVQYFRNEEGPKKWQIAEITICRDTELRKKIVEAPWNLIAEEKPKSKTALKKERKKEQMEKKERNFTAKQGASKEESGQQHAAKLKYVSAIIIEIRIIGETKSYFVVHNADKLTEMKVENPDDEKNLIAGRAVTIALNKYKNFAYYNYRTPSRFVEFMRFQLPENGVLIERAIVLFFAEVKNSDIDEGFAVVKNTIIGTSFQVPLSAIEKELEVGKSVEDIEAICAYGEFDCGVKRWKLNTIQYLRYFED